MFCKPRAAPDSMPKARQTQTRPWVELLVAYMTLAKSAAPTKQKPQACVFIMLGRLRDAVADVRDAGSNATRWLGIDELAQAAAYAGSGNERWRIVGARKAVAEEPELECNAAAVECSISGGVRGHAALQALRGTSPRRARHRTPEASGRPRLRHSRTPRRRGRGAGR